MILFRYKKGLTTVKVSLITVLVIAGVMWLSLLGASASTLGSRYKETSPTTAIGAGGSIMGCGIPDNYAAVFTAAVKDYAVSPALIAAIFYAGEHGNSWPEISGPWAQGAQTSSGTAKGPFQFKDATWARYGLKGDVQDINDAAKAAANMFYQNIAEGKGDEEHNIRNAIANYNTSTEYIEKVYAQYLEFLQCVTEASLASECPDGTGTANGNVIVLDPGHPGDGASGTSGSDGTKVVTEREIVYGISLRMETVLTSMGYTVYNTKKEFARENNLNVDLNNPQQMANVGASKPELTNQHRAEIANKFGAALMFRIHNNGGNGTSNKFFFEYPDQGMKSALLQTSTKSLVGTINSKISDLGPLKKVAPKTETQASGGILKASRYVNMPVVLVELGGLQSSNGYTAQSKQDVLYLESSSGQNEVAKALATALSGALPLNSTGMATRTVNCSIANAAIQTALATKSENPTSSGMKGKASDYAQISRNWSTYSACSNFVAYIMKKSGVDPGFKNGSVVGTEFPYIKSSGKYELLPSSAGLQPGDILIRGTCSNGKCAAQTLKGYGHIEVYVGQNDTFPGKKFIGASMNHHGPTAQAGADLDGMGIIARFKGTSS